MAYIRQGHIFVDNLGTLPSHKNAFEVLSVFNAPNTSDGFTQLSEREFAEH